MNYGFVIDNRKCIGCHACTVACKSEHDVPLGVNRTYVKYVEKGVFPNTRRTFTVTRCNHCEDAPCAEICPTSALFTRRDGIVDFDSDRCIACKSCMQACPYDALYIDPATHTAAKCNYCAHRIESGYEPACVIVCPVEAIVSGDLHDPDSKISRLTAREQVSVRKPEKGTIPNVYYIDGDWAALDPLANDRLQSYLFAGQAAGVGHFSGDAAPTPDAGLVDPTEPLRRSQGGVALAGAISLSQRAIDDVGREIQQREGGRRVYDTPDKGVLWGWQVPAYIWTKAVSTGIFILMAVAGWFRVPVQDAQSSALLASLVFLAVTGGLLVADLDRPERFLYVLLRPNWRSWLVRGAYLIAGFGGVAALMWIAGAAGWTGVQQALIWPGFLLAAGGAVYTAFLLAQAKGRDLWQSPLASVRMINHAVMAGSACWMAIEPSEIGFFSSVLLGSITLNLALLGLEWLTPHASENAARSARAMVRGSCGLFFFAGIGMGSVVPLGLLLVDADPMKLLAGGLALAGIFLTEYAWVRAPQLVPLA